MNKEDKGQRLTKEECIQKMKAKSSPKRITLMRIQNSKTSKS